MKVASDFYDIITKKAENSSGRSSSGNKVDRGVDFVLTSKLSVML